MVKPNLLLSFDAFGTLFKPKSPIATQYAQAARHLGLAGFTDEQLGSSIRAAFKAEAKENPNYGKATGLGATAWWKNVIHRSFRPFLENNQVLPPDLAPMLLHRFSSSQGYEPTEPNLIAHLKTLKQPSSTRPLYNDLAIGVVTNSDDRVPLVLASLGLRVSARRYGALDPPIIQSDDAHDVDFHCMSYDVGVEKPHSSMFQAAELMLAHHISASRPGDHGNTALEEAKAEAKNWTKIHVGDEFAKDVVGALVADWNAVLLDPGGHNDGNSIPFLEHSSSAGTLEDFFGRDTQTVVRVRSLHSLIGWLRGE